MKYNSEIEIKKVDIILDKLTEYSVASEKHQILIYGQGGQPRSFYRALKLENDVDVIWTGWSGPTWTLIFSFIPGHSGLIKLKNKSRLKELYTDIGSLSFSSLFFVDKDTEQKIFDRIKHRRTRDDFVELIENSDNNFLLEIDFDYHGGQRDGEVVYKIVHVGQSVDPAIVHLLSEE